MYWINFNNIKNRDLDVEVVQRPNIPAAVRRVEYVTIAGRDGVLTVDDETYEPRLITVPMNFITKRGYDFMNKTRAITNWLTGSGILRCSDDPDGFYKVYDASVSDSIERQLRRAGFFSAAFNCDPYFYFDGGQIPISLEEAKLNPYNKCHPVYYITGSGNCTLTVNGNSITPNVHGNLVIDTDLMLMYKANGTLQNTNVRCKYKDFRLQNGMNEIAITNGFDLKIKTNWRSL